MRIPSQNKSPYACDSPMAAHLSKNISLWSSKISKESHMAWTLKGNLQCIQKFPKTTYIAVDILKNLSIASPDSKESLTIWTLKG